MRRFLTSKAALVTALSLAVIFLAAPHAAHAGFWDLITDGPDFMEKLILAPFELLVLPLAATIMWIGGLLLDAAIGFSLHTAYIVSLSPAIDLGWIIVRDLCNLFFIFALIWISLQLITGLDTGWKGALTKLIIAAILINFSLFFTKALIDVSNVFGNWLYGGIEKTLEYNSTDTTKKTSISGLITARMGVLHLWGIGTGATENNSEANSTFRESLTNPSRSFIGIFLRLAIVLMVAYIFMYAAILFLARAVTLLFLAVFSPIMVLSGAFPMLKKYSGMWWDELNKALVFPVAFLLMLYISLQFINSLGVLELPALKDGAAPMGISVSQYFQYFIIIFLLQATLKMAKEYSGTVGDAMGGVASGLTKLATSYVVGGAIGGLAFAGKRFIGSRLAGNVDDARLNDMAAGRVGGNAFTRTLNKAWGNSAIAAAKAGSKASFDPRGIDAVQSGMKGLGVDLGKAKEGGYKQMVKDYEEKEKKRAEEFGDSPEGIARRQAYAQDKRGSALTWLAVGDKNREKLAGKLSQDAGAAYVKAQTEDKKKDMTKTKSELVTEQVTIENFKRAMNADDIKQIDFLLGQEVNRMNTLEKDNEKQLLRLKMLEQDDILSNPDASDEEKANALAANAELSKQFEEATKGMKPLDRNKLIEGVKKGKTDLQALRKFIKDHRENIAASQKETDLNKKKDAVKKLNKVIEDERIGESPEGWNEGAETNPGEKLSDGSEAKVKMRGRWKKPGSGLLKKLQKQKSDFEQENREQQLMEGKTPSNKPVKGKPETDAEYQARKSNEKGGEGNEGGEEGESPATEGEPTP